STGASSRQAVVAAMPSFLRAPRLSGAGVNGTTPHRPEKRLSNSPVAPGEHGYAGFLRSKFRLVTRLTERLARALRDEIRPEWRQRAPGRADALGDSRRRNSRIRAEATLTEGDCASAELGTASCL